MKGVKPSGNATTELKLIRLFKQNDIRGWRRNYRIYGQPDFAFIKYKLAVFTDGCFWHAHNCRNTTPKINIDFWENKINRNITRDIEVNEHLNKRKWLVVRIWECELQKGAKKQIEQIKLIITG
jgi:DNA mismatch endonuclease (patch repair protein)